LDDIFGLAKSTDKIISAVERALGSVYRPYGMRKIADAEEYRFTKLELAKTDVEARNKVELAKAKAKADMILADSEESIKERLNARLEHKAIQQQKNIEKIVAGALILPQPRPAAEDVDQDWLNNFFERAQGISESEMQALWSKVLTLEVGMPGTFSRRALDVLQNLNKNEAKSFQVACNLACSFTQKDPRGIILHGASYEHFFFPSQTKEIELHEFGLPYLERKNLEKIGLLYEEHLVTGVIDSDFELTIYFESTHKKLYPKRRGLKLNNFSFTPIGLELSVLVTPDENIAYIEALCNSLTKFFRID
jgi:uncharacterized repeat protein (TIGR03899 family)